MVEEVDVFVTLMAPATRRYVIITPVKNEAGLLPRTLDSVASQTIKPDRWIIVDDGSTDATAYLVEQFATRHPWVVLHRTGRAGPRQPGQAVIQAFREGLSLIDYTAYDLIVKLDADLCLPTTYFESLLTKFGLDPKLGIASGVYFELGGSRWGEVKMPSYHAAGASKMVRTACFSDIGGFVCSRGWDTVDEIRAQLCGWRTTHFRDIAFQHLKPEGSGIGSLRTNFMHGEIYYLTGGGGLFLVAKLFRRAISGRPFVLGALAMLFGYLNSAIVRKKRLVTNEETAHYKGLLNRRIVASLKMAVPAALAALGRGRS